MNQAHYELSITLQALPLAPQPAWSAPDAVAVVLTRPLNEAEWRMMREFVRGVTAEDMRLRFGRPLDFSDETTMRRFFDVNAGTGEIVCMLDAHGEIVGVLHRILTSAGEAELALLVRSDRKRAGIGETLLRIEIARAAGCHLQTLRALVLYENTAMLRLARKAGFVSRRMNGPAVELELEVSLNVGAKSAGVRPQ